MTDLHRAITTFVTEHPNWTYDGAKLHTTQTFSTFMDAVDAINAIAREADAADHHPDLFNSYSTVTITLHSHDVSAVTERDLALAEAIDGIMHG